MPASALSTVIQLARDKPRPMTSFASPYPIRESKRAKYVNIKVSSHGAVEIVVPRNFDYGLLPEILAKRKDWIEQTAERLQNERQTLTLEPDDDYPTVINARAIAQLWQVNYVPTDGRGLRYQVTGDRQLTLTGATHSADLCHRALRKWLHAYTKAQLTPWLRDISQDLDLPFTRISVRGQRTRWASCSSQKAISLNYKLLFLPPALVRYVFVHELCHTQHMNHSPRFWALVAQHDPDYEESDRALATAWRYIPKWVDI